MSGSDLGNHAPLGSCRAISYVPSFSSLHYRSPTIALLYSGTSHTIATSLWRLQTLCQGQAFVSEQLPSYRPSLTPRYQIKILLGHSPTRSVWSVSLCTRCARPSRSKKKKITNNTRNDPQLTRLAGMPFHPPPLPIKVTCSSPPSTPTYRRHGSNPTRSAHRGEGEERRGGQDGGAAYWRHAHRGHVYVSPRVLS